MSKQLEMPFKKSLQREESLKTNEHLNTSQFRPISLHKIQNSFLPKDCITCSFKNLSSFLTETPRQCFLTHFFYLKYEHENFAADILLTFHIDYSGKESSLEYDVVTNSKHLYIFKFFTQLSAKCKQQIK